MAKFDLHTAMQSPLTTSMRNPRTVPSLLTKEEANHIKNMANTTFDINSLVSSLTKVTATSPGAVVAPVVQYATLAEVPVGQGNLPVEVPICTAGNTTLEDPTNFEPADDGSTIDNRPATLTLYCQPFGMTSGDIQNGFTVNQIFQKNLAIFEASLQAAIFAKLTTATFGEPVVSVASDAFGVGDFDSLIESVASNRRCVVLDSPYFVRVKPDWFPARFNNLHEASAWPDTLRGFSSDPSGLIVPYALPQPPQPVSRSIRQIMTLPNLRVPCEVTAWHGTASKSDRVCLSVYLGAVHGDADALKLLHTPA